MRFRGRFVVGAALFVACIPAIAAPQYISAGQDPNNTPHPRTLDEGSPVRVTCIDIYAPEPNGKAIACYVKGPGINRQLKLGESAETTGAGTVILTCKGDGFIYCRARIDDLRSNPPNGQSRIDKTISASADTSGDVFPADFSFYGSATVTCSSATGQSPVRPSCNINHQLVEINSSIAASGSVHLECNGTTPLTCSARIHR